MLVCPSVLDTAGRQFEGIPNSQLPKWQKCIILATLPLCGWCWYWESGHLFCRDITKQLLDQPSNFLTSATYCSTNKQKPALINLRSLGAISSEVNSCRHSHYQPRNGVTTKVKILPPGITSLEHLPLQQVQLHPLQTQPAKHREQWEVQEASSDGAYHLKMAIKTRTSKATQYLYVLYRSAFKAK